MPDAPVVLERDPVFYLWPANLPAWHFFHACRTQWRHGFDGETGLDYPGVECVMRQRHVPPRRRDRLWSLLRAAEAGFLEGRREKREERDAEREAEMRRRGRP